MNGRIIFEEELEKYENDGWVRLNKKESNRVAGKGMVAIKKRRENGRHDNQTTGIGRRAR